MVFLQLGGAEKCTKVLISSIYVNEFCIVEKGYEHRIGKSFLYVNTRSRHFSLSYMKNTMSFKLEIIK